MAITWGPARSSRTNAFRIGYEFTQSPARVTSSTSSVSLTRRLYVQSRYPLSDTSNNLYWTGNWGSGSTSVNVRNSGYNWSSSNIVLGHTSTITVNTVYGSSVSRSFGASMSGFEGIPGTASVHATHTVPWRPYLVPRPPSNVRAVRNTDNRHTITWNNNPTSSAPYGHVRLQRWDSAGQSWRTIANIHHTSDSFVDVSTVPNRRYRWRVLAVADAGNSAVAGSNYLTTSPAASSNVSASKTNAGDIQVTWRNNTTSDHGATHVEVYEQKDGGAWPTTPLTVLSGLPTSWVHSNPDNSVTHTYRIRIRGTHDSPTVYSDYSSASNTVLLLAPPNPPTPLSPVDVVDATGPVTFRWRHNPTDTTEQERYTLAYRPVGTSAYTNVNGTGSAQEHTLPAGTINNGTSYEWAIRTWGAFKGGPSAYSYQTFIGSTAPIATIEPIEDGIVNNSRFTGEWSYFDLENTDQSAWQVQLLNNSDSVIESSSGSGTRTSYRFTTTIQNTRDYVFRVRVRDGDGLWSEWVSEGFTAIYPNPPIPLFRGELDTTQGSVVLEVENPQPSDDEVPTVSNTIYRLREDGLWDVVEENLVPNSAVLDQIPRMGKGHSSVYVVETMSDMPSSSFSEPIVVSTEPDASEQWIWLNGGSGWGVKARLEGNPKVSNSFSREKTLRKFWGRRYPVEFASNHRNRTISLSGDLSLQIFNTENDFMSVADLPSPLCYRDVYGRKVFVSIDDLKTDQEFQDFLSVSLNLTEIDYDMYSDSGIDLGLDLENVIPVDPGEGMWNASFGSV